MAILTKGGDTPMPTAPLYIRLPFRQVKFHRARCSRDGVRPRIQPRKLNGRHSHRLTLPTVFRSSFQPGPGSVLSPALVLPCAACRDPPSPSKVLITALPSTEQRGPGGNPPSSTRSTPSPSSIPMGTVSGTSVASIPSSTISGIWASTSSGCRPYTSPR